MFLKYSLLEDVLIPPVSEKIKQSRYIAKKKNFSSIFPKRSGLELVSPKVVPKRTFLPLMGRLRNEEPLITDVVEIERSKRFHNLSSTIFHTWTLMNEKYRKVQKPKTLFDLRGLSANVNL